MLMSSTEYGFRDQREKQFPLMICLEITNVCNFHCIHCPYTYVSQRREYVPRFMQMQVYEKILEETSEFKDTIFRFVCDGEPMIHPDFLRMVENAKKRGIAPVCVTTNGYFLTEENAKRLIGYGCDLIEVSIDALYEESYNKVRIGGDFRRVVGNILRLIDLRNRLNKDVKLMVSAIDQPFVSGELDAFKQYWARKVDKVIIRTLTSIGGLVKKDGGRDFSEQKGERWPCPLLWQRFFINTEGYAEFCVDDWLDETIIADIKERSISEVWAGIDYQKIRKVHLDREFSQVKKCSCCFDWKARTWEYDYFHALKEILAPRE